MTLNHLMAASVAELAEGDVPAPLSQRFTLAALWCDLARLAGETPPAAVALIAEGLPVALDGPAHAPIYRERYQEPA